jgi:hypothetical protein
MTDAQANQEPLFYKITSAQLTEALNTRVYFSRPPRPKISAVDEFLQNAYAINKLFLHFEAGPDLEMPAELAGLVVLGYMSAVESYLRKLTRHLIGIDDLVCQKFEQKPLSFGAALHLKKEMLPEALLENISFSDAAAVKELYRSLCDASNVPAELEAILQDYNRVCAIRHCCVHRFGRLGMNNAVQLGLQSHKSVVEHTFAPKASDLSMIANVMVNFVRTFNGLVFKAVLLNTVKHQYLSPKDTFSWKWSWTIRKDRSRFRQYYEMFAVQLDVPRSSSLSDLYFDFRASEKKKIDAKAAKAAKDAAGA